MSEATTLEAPPEQEIPSPPQSDAAVPNADAAEQEVRDFIAARKGGGQGGTEAGNAVEDDPELKAAREAAARAATQRAERETRERIAREERDRREAETDRQNRQRFEQSYRDRMAARLQLSDELQGLGLSKADADRIAKREHDDFNSHHADGLQLHKPAATREAMETVVSQINDAVKGTLGNDADKFFGTEAEPKGYANIAEVFTSFKEIVTAGLLTEAEAEERETAAVLAFRRALEKAGRLTGTSSGQQVNSNSASSGDRHFDNEDALHTAYGNRDITNEHYAREYKRLTGRDLSGGE